MQVYLGSCKLIEEMIIWISTKDRLESESLLHGKIPRRTLLNSKVR